MLNELGAMVNALSKLVQVTDERTGDTWITRDTNRFQYAAERITNNIQLYVSNNGIRDYMAIKSTKDELQVKYPFGVVKITPKAVFPTKTETLIRSAKNPSHARQIYANRYNERHNATVALTAVSVHPYAEALIWPHLIKDKENREFIEEAMQN